MTVLANKKTVLLPYLKNTRKFIVKIAKRKIDVLGWLKESWVRIRFY